MRTSAAIGVAIALLAAAPACSGEERPALREAVAPQPGAIRAETTARPRPPFDRSRHSTADPRSIWVVVNKSHPIEPPDYRPEIALVRGYQVAAPAAQPLRELLADSDARGLGFKIASAFRSYGYQQGVYASAVASRGRAEADRVSARPGHSEHQTGLAVDLVTPASPECDFDPCFADTRGGRWLAEHAWRHGFIVRYRPGTTAITGYSPEPWHLRFVGRALAAQLRRTHTATLEEFFGIGGGDYA